MRGRKPVPTALKISAGDPRKVGKAKLEARLAAEPVTVSGLPTCPSHLKGRARAAWRFWSEALAVMGLDKRPDAMMLEGACVGYEQAVQADEIIRRDGPLLESSVIDEESGERVVLKTQMNPAVRVSRTAWTQVHRFCTEFGLSPVSRTRLAIEKKTESETDLMAALTQPRTIHSPAVN